MKAVILYASFTGNTRIIAHAIAEGLREGGVDISVQDVRKAKPEDLEHADILVVGSATYGGRPMRRAVKFLGRLPDGVFEAKVCGVYAVNASRGGSDVIEELSRLLMEKGIEEVVAGPVIAAGIPFIPLRRPTSEDLKSAREFGKALLEAER